MAAKKKFGIEAIFSAIDKLSAPIAKIQTKLGALGKHASGALKGVNKAVDKGLAGIGKFSDAIGIAGVASVAGIGLALTDAMRKGIEFEDSLIRAGAALETPVAKGTAGYRQLSDAARMVGKTTEHSAQAASAALEVLATAGYTALQSIGALPKIADFASAGKLDLAQASEVAASTLGAFNLKVADATQNSRNMARVMDVLVRSSADSSASVSEMFEAIKMGGPSAAGAGASIEDFAAAANVLADSGVKGSMAGTALRNVFVRLSKQTPAAAEAMKKYRISVAKSRDGSIDMAATVGRFNKAMKGVSLTQRVAALDTIFGSEAMTAFQSLMAAGPEKINKFTDSLENASGTAKTMAETARTATGARIEMLVNKLNDVKLTVFESLAPVLLDVADAVGAWVTEHDKLVSDTTNDWLLKLRDNLPEIWTWTVRIAKAFAGFLVFAATVKAINVAILAFEVAAKLAAGAAWLWNAASKANVFWTARLAVEIVAYRVALIASRVATVATTAATWLYNAAITAGQLANTRFTAAQVAAKIAQLASRAATVVATAAQAAYSAVVTTTTLATTRFTAAEVASKIAQLASRAATLVATAAQTAYAAVVAVTSGALGAFTAATTASLAPIAAQAAALAPLLITLGAATAAVMALVAAWTQYNKLDKSLSGSGGVTGTIGKMVEMGTFDPFKAHDAAMNEKAQADRRAREQPQVVSPQERAARETAEANAQASVDGKITVATAPGTKATVATKPRTVPLQLQPSGAF